MARQFCWRSHTAGKRKHWLDPRVLLLLLLFPFVAFYATAYLGNNEHIELWFFPDDGRARLPQI